MRAETEAAIEAMRAALPLLREGHGRGEVQVKEALDYVTATDVAVERLIGERLTSAFPEYGVLGEESGLSGSGERFWVIDPICGTTNYAIGLPVYNVNVALVEDGSVTCAALLEPLTERLYWAE